MILPTTYLTALLLTILTMICWGSWHNTTKMAGKRSFELFYFDYSFGVLVTATILAFTLGSMGSELSFQDNLLITSKRPIAYALAAGGVFNLANMLLVAAISLAGMAVAFPIGIGLALIIGVIGSYIVNPQGNPVFLFAGAALLLVGIIMVAKAYKLYAQMRADDRARERGRAVRPARLPAKGIAISLACGVLMGMFYPLVELSKQGELGLRAYAVAFVFALGVFLTTPFYNLVFMNIPVKGKPVRIRQYLEGTFQQHLLGLLGGAVWMVGTVANFCAASAPPEVQVGPAVSYGIGQGAVLVSTLWGILYWKEFQGASSQVNKLVTVMVIVFVCGLALIALAPLFA